MNHSVLYSLTECFLTSSNQSVLLFDIATMKYNDELDNYPSQDNNGSTYTQLSQPDWLQAKPLNRESDVDGKMISKFESQVKFGHGSPMARHVTLKGHLSVITLKTDSTITKTESSCPHLNKCGRFQNFMNGVKESKCPYLYDVNKKPK